MMETRLWAALCALLLIHQGSAEQGTVTDDGHDTATIASRSGGAEAVPVAPGAEAVPSSSLAPISHAVTSRSPNDPGTDPSPGVTISPSNGPATGGRSISLTPAAKTDDGTDVVSTSQAAAPGNNLTDHVTSQSPPSRSHTPTPHVSLASTASSPLHTAHTAPADGTLAAALPATTLHPSAFPLSDSSTRSHQTGTSPWTPESEATTASAVTQSSPAPGTSSSQEPPASVPPSLTSPRSASQPGRHSETTSVVKQTSTLTTPSSTSAQAKVQANTPSQLNVGGDTKVVHESPTLDPLLAGLVSAFIITAVIITLLLFLKLRQRDNRPEFRRLQDLPMDDIMEDTPLSMYSY